MDTLWSSRKLLVALVTTLNRYAMMPLNYNINGKLSTWSFMFVGVYWSRPVFTTRDDTILVTWSQGGGVIQRWFEDEHKHIFYSPAAADVQPELLVGRGEASGPMKASSHWRTIWSLVRHVCCVCVCDNVRFVVTSTKCNTGVKSVAQCFKLFSLN